MYVLPPEASGAEFRDLLAYWQSKLVPGRLPGRQHVDPTELPRRHLSHLLLLDVVEAAPPMRRRYRFRVAGTGFSSIAGRDVTGLHYDEIEGPERSIAVMRALDLIVARKAPVFLADRVALSAQEHLWVKRLGLPLAHDGHTVDMILAVWLATPRAAADRTPDEIAGEPATPQVLERR